MKIIQKLDKLPMLHLENEQLQQYRDLLQEMQIPSKSHTFYLRWVHLYAKFSQKQEQVETSPFGILQVWLQEIAMAELPSLVNQVSVLLSETAQSAWHRSSP